VLKRKLPISSQSDAQLPAQAELEYHSPEAARCTAIQAMAWSATAVYAHPF